MTRSKTVDICFSIIAAALGVIGARDNARKPSGPTRTYLIARSLIDGDLTAIITIININERNGRTRRLILRVGHKNTVEEFLRILIDIRVYLITRRRRIYD